MDARLDVVALGEAMVEFNQLRAGAPDYLQGFGGDTSNAIIAAARAGARTAYLTRLGDDMFGRELLELWQREGVGTQAVALDHDAPTGIYFVTHGDNGHAFHYRRAGSAASRMTREWLQGAAADAIRQARILHVSGISLAISPSACEAALAAMQIARSHEVRVAFDCNLRLKLWTVEAARAAIARAMALTDIFLPSLDDVTALIGIADPQGVIDWGHAAGAGIVVLKLGEHGALASDGTQREHIRAHLVQAVDATGAGDCFAGNFLARLAAGDGVHAAARYANAAAALAVQGFGAVAPLPRPAQVRELL